MTFWESADMVIREAWSPALWVIGAGGLFGLWVVQPLARHAREHWFGAKRREFLSHFSSMEQTNARNTFRWSIERAYRRYDSGKQGDLPERLRAIKWPSDFPPNGRISSYASNLRFDDSAESLWLLAQKIIEDRLNRRASEDGQCDCAIVDDLYAGWLTAAKFWDDWARQLSDGLLTPSDMRRPVESNLGDICAIALIDLAQAKILGWDDGRGKRALYELAIHGVEMGGGTILARFRKWLASRLSAAAKWVNS